MPWRRRICATSPNSSSSSPLPTLALTALPLAGVSDLPGLAAGSPAVPDGATFDALPPRWRRSAPETTNSSADAPATMTPDQTLGEKMNDAAKPASLRDAPKPTQRRAGSRVTGRDGARTPQEFSFQTPGVVQ